MKKLLKLEALNGLEQLKQIMLLMEAMYVHRVILINKNINVVKSAFKKAITTEHPT